MQPITHIHVQVFKHAERNRHLYVRPGEAFWSLEWGLNDDDIGLRGGRANKTCPAHPSSCLDQQREASNWQFMKGGEWETAEILLRCPTHDLANSKWLVEQGREEKIPREKVAAYLCQEDKDGSCLLADMDDDLQKEVAEWNLEAAEKIAHKLSLEVLQLLIKERVDGHFEGKELGHVVWKKDKEGAVAISQLDFETQKQVAFWSPEETSKNAHLASQDFILWLITQAKEGKWSKEEVANIVFRKTTSNHLIFATLDNETKREVAKYNKKLTISALPYMDEDFIKWVVNEASEGRWDQQEVFNAVVKEESDGRAHFTAKIKPGGTP